MIQLNYRDAKPIYEQIKDGMRHLVISNALTADEKLPSVRELAATLAINPNTIQRAYRDLEKRRICLYHFRERNIRGCPEACKGCKNSGIKRTF